MRSKRLNQSPSSGQNASTPALHEADVLLPVRSGCARRPRVSPGAAGIVPCSVGSRSRSHGTMWTTTLTLRACMSASTVFRIALEDVGVEVERRLARVPAARREAGAEIDHRVERNLLRAERVDDAEHLRFVFERAMRLHVAERPLRRHRRRAGDRARSPSARAAGSCASKTNTSYRPGDDRCRPAAGPCRAFCCWLRSFCGTWSAGGGFHGRNTPRSRFVQIDLHPRRRDEQAPSGRAEQHRDRIARAVHVALPARLHRVERAAPIELHRLLAPWPAGRRPRSAFAHPEHRLIVELNDRLPSGSKTAAGRAARAVLDDNRQRIRPDLDVEAADGAADGTFDLAEAEAGGAYVRSTMAGVWGSRP